MLNFIRILQMEYNSYDIHNRMVRANTTQLLHKNAPHIGDRYVIVCFNKNLNYSGSEFHLRSCAIRKTPMVHTGYTATFDTPEVTHARNELLALLGNTKFPKDRCTNLKNSVVKPHSKYLGNAEFVSFGVTASRKSKIKRALLGKYTRESSNYNNTKFAPLYQAFQKYMDVFAPGKLGVDGVYHAAIISKNSQCEFHVDTGNIGHASLSALGSFEGGELLVQTSTSFF